MNSNSKSKLWIVLGISVAGVVLIAAAESARRRRRRNRRRISIPSADFGAFIERFDLAPAPQPPPPAAKLPLAGLTFAVSDNFEIKGYVAGFGNPDWKKTHEASSRTAFAVTVLRKAGARCVGRTVMGEMGFGFTGENLHYGTPFNPILPSHIPGGSSSGSAVAVASHLVDFALGIDTAGCVRIPASLCGVLGFRPSHGVVSAVGILSNSQSLETIGWFSSDPSILQHVGNILLQASPAIARRSKRFFFADDCFQFSKLPKEKSIHVMKKTIEKLNGYEQPKHMNIGQFVASNIPSLRSFYESLPKSKQGIAALKALSKVMLSLQRYEFKENHEEWVNKDKPRMGMNISSQVLAAVNSSHDDIIKSLYKTRIELRSAFNNLLKDDGILVVPTTPEFPLKHQKKLSPEFEEQLCILLSIAGVSGCCQASIPLGMHEGYPVSVSLIAAHGADKFLLDTVLDMSASLQEEISVASNLNPAPDVNGSLEVSELLKEKGNAAFKGRQWNKAVNFYSEAININDTNATYYCNRAAAYLELGCFRQAEADCNQAISLDKKNVKAYLRRGTAREMLLSYKEAIQDFKHALALEPQNKAALAAEKRLRKLMT